MSIISQKRGGLVLLSSPKHVSSHRIRLICHAKDLEIEYVDIDADNLPEDLIEINPTGKLPTLLDRDLVLFNDRVVSEYLDERFPHPALMPIEANLRAKIRLFCLEIEDQWYELVNQLEHEKVSPTKKKGIQKNLRDFVIMMSPMMKNGNYMMGSELSLLDCCILPVLWRLESLGIELPKTTATQPLQKYMAFHFKQEYFKKSMSKYELSLRETI
ncbi:glutathione S-transferase N-terminal domain-containing protein [Suttonella ornithocola]|uniref:Stringent starvation protein A n=1 Tax=Suttonella ornithocola TaxID=279832 RepID=A0A380MYG5_9GAMM|nr:glutathione S-transferase N-terminal domain-containing protein [Suttonella ornithocola]SUO97264.1 Stringent starvation protein A [Suttonella ornithocola]